MNTDTPSQRELQKTQDVVTSVRLWLERVVIGLGLCPFAHTPVSDGTVRYVVTAADDAESLLNTLALELTFLAEHADVETTLLIHPDALTDFGQYNQFLTLAEELLAVLAFDGVFQIASFHPQYQFAGTAHSDAENYSNRSPHPMLHVLRETSVGKALLDYNHPENIPLRNIRKLDDIGSAALAQLVQSCVICE